MVSKNMEQLIKQIYADSEVSVGEVINLHNAVEEAEQRILEHEGDAGVVAALCKSFDVTNQLIQESLLRFELGEYSDLGRAMLRSVLEANVALMQANIDAFE